MIPFDAIPVSVLTPGSYIEFSTARATKGLPLMPWRILVVGQKLPAGDAVPNVVVPVYPEDSPDFMFGQGSMLSREIKALRKVNTTIETWALPLVDLPGGTAATQTITVTTSQDEDGTLALYVCGVQVTVQILEDDSKPTVATNIAAAINANLDLPVTATSAGAVVTVTARHKGLVGQEIDIRPNMNRGDKKVHGLVLTIAAGVTGAGNPDVSAVFTAIGDSWFNAILHPYTDATNLAVIEAELASRYGPMVQTDAMAFTMARGSLGTLAALGASRNSPHSVIGGIKGLPTWTAEAAMAFAGQVALSASINPARPFKTLALTGVVPPDENSRFSRTERDQLLRDGISTFTVDAGGVVRIDRLVTTYRTDAFGLPDTAYQDVTTRLILSYLRFSVRVRIAQKFPRCTLADDQPGFVPPSGMVTPKIIRNELIALASDWRDAGLVENVDQFAADIVVERDASDRNRVNVMLPPDLVNQFLVLAGQVQFIV